MSMFACFNECIQLQKLHCNFSRGMEDFKVLHGAHFFIHIELEALQKVHLIYMFCIISNINNIFAFLTSLLSIHNSAWWIMNENWVILMEEDWISTVNFLIFHHFFSKYFLTVPFPSGVYFYDYIINKYNLDVVLTFPDCKSHVKYLI